MCSIRVARIQPSSATFRGFATTSLTRDFAAVKSEESVEGGEASPPSHHTRAGVTDSLDGNTGVDKCVNGEVVVNCEGQGTAAWQLEKPRPLSSAVGTYRKISSE